MNGRARGMTLLEMMVVVAIVGIMVGLSAYGFQGGIAHRKVIEAERAILDAGLRARQLSRATNQPVRLAVGLDTVGGATVTRARWEQLPCQDKWATQCPSEACKANLCGKGGCECQQVGDPVVLPDGFDAKALNGLCWLPGTGRPAFSADKIDCSSDYAAPDPSALKLLSNGQLLAVVVVERLTGLARLEDCQRGDRDASICK
jgi:prepilin-type N-terminal cleavage/methylation domain-containing protein